MTRRRATNPTAVRTDHEWVVRRRRPGDTPYPTYRYWNGRDFTGLRRARRFRTEEGATAALAEYAAQATNATGRSPFVSDDEVVRVGPLCPTRKRGYLTDEDASRVLLVIWRDGLSRVGSRHESRTYRCEWCMLWHLTSRFDRDDT